MPSYPIPENEKQRLSELLSYHILDTADEKDFDDLTRLASVICGTDIALISLVDEQRQWFKSRHGLATTETDREYSFCAHAIAEQTDIMIIENASEDVRFAHNPLVTGDPNITFYAGVPLRTERGFPLGTLCVIDPEKKQLSAEQISALKILSKQVIDKMELRKKMADLEHANAELLKSQLAISALNRNLHETESRLRLLIEQATVAIIIFKGDNFVIEAANPAMLLLLNKTKAIVGQPLLEAVPELSGQRPYQLLHSVYSTGEPVYGNNTPVTLHRNGKTETGYFNFSYTPLIENGKVTGVIDTANEVTEQFLVLKQIEETENLLQMAVTSANIGTWQADPRTDRFTLSERAREIYQLAGDELLSLSEASAMIADEQRDTITAVISAAFKSGHDFIEEFVITPKNSTTTKWLRTSGRVRYDEAGNIKDITGTILDISAQKEIEQRKDDFISIASHELKTPITSLKGTIQLLERLKNKLDLPIVPKLIEQSVISIDKINGLVDDLLNVTRLNEGQIELQKAHFTLKNMLFTCAEQIQRSSSKQVVISGEPEISVFADENRVEQVVINLLNNAVKYAPETEIVGIHVSMPDQTCIRIAVSDQGRGIPPEKLPHLFERYYRSDQSGVHYFGLGLGLYICSEIIRRHNGEIGAESILGKGSTFWFTLPVHGK